MKSARFRTLIGITCFCYCVAPVRSIVPAIETVYALVTIHVHTYEAGAHVMEQLKTANAHAGVSCRQDDDPPSGTVLKSSPGYFIFCGYGLSTSRLPSKNIIIVRSIANDAEGRTTEHEIFDEFIRAVKDSADVDGMECLVGDRSEC